MRIDVSRVVNLGDAARTADGAIQFEGQIVAGGIRQDQAGFQLDIIVQRGGIATGHPHVYAARGGHGDGAAGTERMLPVQIHRAG